MDWLRIAASARPGAPALITGERTISYAALDRAADGLAAVVASAAPLHSVVGFVAVSTPEAVAAVWAIPRAGALAVPIDPHLPADQVAAVAQVVLPADSEFDAMLEVPLHPVRGGMPGDAGFVVFTSGSEGTRKGVVLTGANVAASVTASAERLGNGVNDPWLAVLPLFHIGGLSILWRQAAAGAPVVLEPSFDPVRCAAYCRKWRSPRWSPRCCCGCSMPEPRRRSPPRGVGGWRTCRSGIVASCHRRPVSPALQTYGMTETCSQVCTVAPRTPSAIWAPPVDRSRVLRGSRRRRRPGAGAGPDGVGGLPR